MVATKQCPARTLQRLDPKGGELSNARPTTGESLEAHQGSLLPARLNSFDTIDFQLEGPVLLISQDDSRAVHLTGIKSLIADDTPE